MTAVAVGAVTQHAVDARAPSLLLAETCPVATAGVTQFNPTGAEQCFTVPPGVTEVEATLVGGFGGTGYNPTSEASSLGGNGATVQAVLYVTPGERVYVEVAGAGYPGGTVAGAGAGGGNGGGNGGSSALAPGSPPAAGGGGETDLRSEPWVRCGATPAAVASLASRLLVAGGGGGGGESNGNSGADGGGRGGIAAGTAQPGTDGQLETSQDGKGGGGATGATPGAGGSAGSVGGTPGSAGTPGCGGNGGNGTGGGGGGAGYFGGGGGGGGAEGAGGSGAGGGGGGGSSYANPLRTCNASSGVQALASARSGPRAIIEYPVRVPCPTLNFVPDVSSAGFVVNAVGSGWQPGVPISFTWRELGSLPADVALTSITPATGSFSLPIVLMTHDEIGERVLVAAQATAALSNSAGLLVAASPEEPPTFLFRR